MSYFLVFLAIAIAGAAVVLSLGRFNSRSASPNAEPEAAGMAEAVASLPPVLLPVPASAADIRALKFSAGFRGYRMDQVDEVLMILVAELERRDQRIAELERGGESREPEAGRPANGG